jgi:outer membrane protein assembly factor BamB
MHRYRTFWHPVLILPLLLMVLTGCSGPCENYPGPDVDPHLLSANGLIYFNSPASHSLYAINMNTGSIRWTYQASGWTFLDNGVIYIDDNNYTIKALDARDGTLLWQKDGRDGSFVSTLFATTDRLAYIATDNGILEAVNGRDGSVLWHLLLKVDPSSSQTDDPSTLQVINGVVYLSTVNSSVFALRERDGALLWQFNTTQGDSLNFLKSTAFGDGMIFISADQTYALRMSDGKLLWRSAQKSSLHLVNGMESSLEANGMLYLGDSRSGVYDSFYALRASDGKQVWHKSFAPTSPRERAENYNMQLIDKVLYMFPSTVEYGSSDHLFALRASDGTQLWEDTLPVRNFSLVALRGILYIFSGFDFDSVSGPGPLEALRETDGTALWSRSLQQAGVLVTNNAIYAGTGGNTDTPCAPFSSAQMEKLQLSDASPIWHRKLDPAPDPFLLTKRVLAILGGLLSVLGLLVFFVSRKGQPKDRLLPSLQEGTVLAIPVVSVPHTKRIGWLLLFIPGIVLLVVAAAMAAQWIH